MGYSVRPANLKYKNLSWQRAKEIMEKDGKGERKFKLTHNTFLFRLGVRTESYAVRLHQTDIVTFYSDGQVELRSGGWKTKITKERMNRILPENVSIESHDGNGTSESPINR
jgi:hypothetical protein